MKIKRLVEQHLITFAVGTPAVDTDQYNCTLLAENSDYYVYEIHDVKTAQALGKGTDWGIALDDDIIAKQEWSNLFNTKCVTAAPKGEAKYKTTAKKVIFFIPKPPFKTKPYMLTIGSYQHGEPDKVPPFQFTTYEDMEDDGDNKIPPNINFPTVNIDGIRVSKRRTDDGQIIEDGELIDVGEVATKAVFPQGQTIIDNVCSKHYHLRSVTLPDSAKVIQAKAFYDCTNLCEINLPDGLHTIEQDAFLGTALPTIRLPDSLVELGNRAFRNTGLFGAQLSNGLKELPDEAFRNCESLRRIQFPQSVVSIGSNAFHTCRVLKSVVLNEGLTTVGSGAFIACLGLEELAFPSTVTTLEINVFYGCSSLRTVTLPEGITALPAGLFSGCSSLSSITVPYSVTTITSTTFRGCTSLTQVTMPVTLSADYLPQSVSVLHLVYRPEAEYTMLCSPNHLDFGMMDDITVYVVPSFEDRHVELTQVTDVAAGTGMLVHAQPGQRYEVLRSTTGELAPGQQSVHRVQQRWLGDAVTDSLSHANDGLLDLYTGPNFLVGTSSSITIPGLQDKKQNFILSQKDGRFLFSAITPAATIDAHSAYLQLPYDEVVGVADLVLPSDTAFTADNSFFADAEVKRVCVESWDTDGDGELSFDEAAAVKSLGTRFKDNKSVKTFNELRHFTSLTQISNEAFYGCSSLTSVMLPPLLRTIGTNAFYGCFVLNAPDFGTHLVAISKGAFTSCTNFRSVSLPSTVRTIGPNAFYYCTGLTEVNIPEGVTEIGENTFSNCRSLPSIKLPNSLTTLRASAFNNTPNLTAVAMPAHIDAALLPKGVTDISLTVKMDAAYATLSSPNSLDFSGDENIKAYTASNLRGTNVYLNQVSDVPAATGIVIHGTAGTEYVVGLGTGAPLKEQNLLVAVTDTVTLEPDTTGTYTDLTLKVLGINVSFEAVNKTTNPRLWTAYLHLDAAQAAGNTSLRANFVNVGNIHFADPVVEQICLEHWDSDADGMLSYDEAAAVTDLGELFKGDTRIRSFMELEYFTGLEHIADSAFCACQNLAAVMLPQGLKTVGRHAFASCYAITEMDLPYSVTSIGTGAFRVCTRLEKVTLPDDAVDLGERLFDYCTHLTTVHLPENLTAIPANMFVNCKRLKSIYIPRYVESVGVSAFYGCPELTTVKKPAVLPDTNIPDVPDMQYYHILSGDWEAFSCPNAVDFTHAENVTAYAVDSYDDGVTYLRQLGDVAAGTGILLHGAYDTEAVFTKGQATEAEPNLLIGAVDSVEV